MRGRWPLKPPRIVERAWESDVVRQSRPQVVFVALVWLGLVAAGAAYILHYSLRTPVRDDWAFVGGLTRQDGLVDWLWEPWVAAKSRVPFQKAALYGIWNL